MTKEKNLNKIKELEQLAARLRDLRKKAGFSNYENFAWTNNISRAQYLRYESGEDIRFTTLLKVIKAHNLTLKEFFSEGFD